MDGLHDPQGDQVFAMAVAEKQQRPSGTADKILLRGTAVPERRHGQVVRQRIANPLSPVRIWVPPSIDLSSHLSAHLGLRTQ